MISPPRLLIGSNLIRVHYDTGMDSVLPAYVEADLERRWSEPHRRHHDLSHLSEVLTSLDTLAHAGEQFDHRPVTIATWFHDSIYNPKRTNNEHQSALLARHLLGQDPDIDEVRRLITLTTKHQPASDDPNGIALSDADLSVLGSSPERYQQYARNVRAEYNHIPTFLYKRLRARILTDFLQRDQIYLTPTAHQQWEAQARLNITAEIVQLRGSRDTFADYLRDPETDQSR